MSQPPAPMRFQIRADAYFVKTADGVWLRNNHGSFSINGQAAYPLVRFLFAGLHSGASIAELCSKVSDEQKKVIAGVIHRLHEKGFIMPPVPTWADALAAAAGRREDRVPLEFYDMSSLLPFARDQAYLVSVELAHEQDRADLDRG